MSNNAVDNLSWDEIKDYISDSDPIKARSNRILLSRNSFELFMRIYLSHIIDIKPGKFQIESFQIARDEDVALIQWPRYYGKSAVFGIGYPLWVGCANPFHINRDRRKDGMMYLSNAIKLCENLISEQKAEIVYNDLLKHDFNIRKGEPSKGETWRSNEYNLIMNNRAVFNVLGLGSGASLRGQHPPIIVLDDFEGDEEAENENSRDKLKYKFRSTVYGMLGLETKKRHAKMLYIGTPNHPECLITDLEKEDWLKVSKYPIMNALGEPLWPDLEGVEEIEEKRRRMGMRSFMAECMLNPVASENPIFNEYMIKEYDEDIFKEAQKDGLYKVVALDPAIKQKQSSDYTAIISVAMTREKYPRFFISGETCRRGRWKPPQIISELADVCESFRPHKVIIEVVAFQEMIKYEWESYMELHGIYHKTEGIHPIKDKELRANVIVPALADGRVYFDTKHPVIQALVSEMMIFPKEGKHIHNDLVDAMVYAITDGLRVSKKKIKKHSGPHIVLPYGSKSELGIVS